eukprot:gene25311-31754_t
MSYCTNSAMQINLSTSDMVLLTQFVANSNAFRANDQHWVPICLPDFNPKGYLQAYISHLRLSLPKTQHTTDVTVILMASNADPELFRELHRGRKYLEQCLIQPSVMERIFQAVGNQVKYVDKYLEPSMSAHFLYKCRPLSANPKDRSGSTPALNQLPSQHIEASMNFPLDNVASRERIWTNYQRLAVCIRVGSSTIESTLLPPLQPPAPPVTTTAGNKKSTSEKVTPLSALEAQLVAMSPQGRETAMVNAAAALNASAPFDVDTILSTAPASNHALAYSVLSTGEVIVALATFDSELYVTYPGTVTPLDASTMADFLSRSLKLDSSQLFQTQH